MRTDQKKFDNTRYSDQYAWVIWAVLVVIAVAILPLVVRNNEIVRHIAAMCGVTIG